ncbi:unnamed protein product [Pseudo-nitzschia multistriata]|uniref:Uncharacterized protein n=1 Tax=Pseudo-nitzschia multistriata TaxID=183589 RepID=A0A448ZQK6_9STRA|nr:unnamed protein product [Pseudo-nitzschia multistriata]
MPTDRGDANEKASDANSMDPNKKTTSADDHKNDVVQPLPTGMPPWHSMTFLATMLSVTIPFLPSSEELDDLSTVETWTHRVYPGLVSLKGLALIRLGTAFVALGLTFYLACINEGWDVHPNYKPHTKLRRDVCVRLQGIGTLCPFTSWCWTMFGVGFLTRGLVALAACLVEEGGDVLGFAPDEAQRALLEKHVLQNRALLRTTMVLWEMSAPLAMLVSCVVKYSIWPQVVKGGKPHNLAGIRNQLQHNCNSIFSLLEVTVLGGIPVVFSHLSMATFMGVVYILFTWTMATAYFGDSHDKGPQYIYWFMDPTLGNASTAALAVLAFVMTFFYALFAVLTGAFLDATNPGIVANTLVLLLGSLAVCRFRD